MNTRIQPYPYEHLHESDDLKINEVTTCASLWIGMSVCIVDFNLDCGLNLRQCPFPAHNLQIASLDGVAALQDYAVGLFSTSYQNLSKLFWVKCDRSC